MNINNNNLSLELILCVCEESDDEGNVETQRYPILPEFIVEWSEELTPDSLSPETQEETSSSVASLQPASSDRLFSRFDMSETYYPSN